MDNNIIDKRTKGEWNYTMNRGINKSMSELFTDIDPVPFAFIKHNEPNFSEQRANAAFICKAVNNYDALKDALYSCIMVMDRARAILQGKDGGNWGMLDTKQAKEAFKTAEL